MEFDKKKPSILLMHGSGLTHIVWSLHEQFYVSQGFNVLSIDLPGHGNSDGPALKSIQEISDWVKLLMKKVNISKIIIVGHSQGCLVGIDFASRYPDLISSLVLVAGSYKMPVNQDLIDLAEAGDDKAILLIVQTLVEKLLFPKALQIYKAFFLFSKFLSFFSPSFFQASILVLNYCIFHTKHVDY